MNKEDFRLCGHIRKLFGYKGEVIVQLQPGLPLNPEQITFAFLDTAFGLVPFEISEIQANGKDTWLFRFTDVQDEASALKIKGLDVYFPIDYLDLPEDHEMVPAALLNGYRVEDRVNGSIGVVTGILELKEQSLLEVRQGTKEHLIPLVEPIITGFNHKKRIVYTDVPEGLLSLSES